MNYRPRAYAKALSEVASGELSSEQEKKMIKNFIALVIKNGDRKKLPNILSQAERFLRQKQGLRKLTFESARPIEDIQSRFANLLQPQDIIETKITPSMVAGIKITMNDSRQFDGSLKNKLDAIFN